MSNKRRVLVLGLDGYDFDYAAKLMSKGKLPTLSKVLNGSACYRLDHGDAKRTGLAFEHFSSGLSPQDANRWSAVHFDTEKYQAWQEPVRFEPFTRFLNCSTVVFDVPYFDLARDQKVRGVVSWGAHDGGTAQAGQPRDLLDHLLARFGTYPAPQWIYGFAWPSAGKCRTMGEGLRAAVARRSEILTWLFGQQITDWDLAIAVVSELHSASEGLWHGADPGHMLASHPSAEVAADALENVYRAVDDLVADICVRFPDVTLVLFSMHGMGTNSSDVASMALLPELLLKRELGKGMLEPKPEWLSSENGVPKLAPKESWQIPLSHPGVLYGVRQTMVDFTKSVVRNIPGSYNWALPNFTATPRLSWMPAMQYQPYWKKMSAFALPSFYDGRIRINLRGREKCGMVDVKDYGLYREKLATFLHQCVNHHTGYPLVKHILFSEKQDPSTLDSSESDIIVEWDAPALAIEHPEVGIVGPLPVRRPGGHTGGLGMATISGPQIAPGNNSVGSAFDVVPTIFQLLNQTFPSELSGTSLLK